MKIVAFHVKYKLQCFKISFLIFKAIITTIKIKAFTGKILQDTNKFAAVIGGANFQ